VAPAKTGEPPTMKIIRQGIVSSKPQDDALTSCAFPSPCVTVAGRWLCAFRAAPTKAGMAGQRTLVTWSDDQGASWCAPIEPFPPQAVDGKPGLIRSASLTILSDGRLLASLCWVDCSDPDAPFFNEESEGLLDTRVFLSMSDDAGETWSPPSFVDTAPYDMPTPITGRVLELPDGELACQFELNKHYDDPEPWRHLPVLMFSQDGGRTWPRHVAPAKDPSNRVFYWDQRPAVLADGRILDVFWTFDREASLYLNIHATESLDSGRTWSEVWDTGVPGQAAPPFTLSDGTIAMPYVDRTAAPAIKVRRSGNGGRSFDEEGELVLYTAGGGTQEGAKASMQDAWSEMEKFSAGLPSTAALPGGGALVVYYAGPETDVTSIHWAEVR
jgi:BNR repeat-like domain